MAVLDPRTWLEHLGTEACWELLATTPVGRLGVAPGGVPEIFPVNFVTDGQTIVFRTEQGSKLAALAGQPQVCFEADHIDVESSTGWSVLVKGRAKVVGTPEESAEVAALPLRFWTLGDKPYFIRVVPTVVTGRRINPMPAT
jgi:nitroimidazol reductase NimA-like FMN-containing flavoprotein (pyridoxamine 5'-phosphate oxidase superfamily)